MPPAERAIMSYLQFLAACRAMPDRPMFAEIHVRRRHVSTSVAFRLIDSDIVRNRTCVFSSVVSLKRHSCLTHCRPEKSLGERETPHVFQTSTCHLFCRCGGVPGIQTFRGRGPSSRQDRFSSTSRQQDPGSQFVDFVVVSMGSRDHFPMLAFSIPCVAGEQTARDRRFRKGSSKAHCHFLVGIFLDDSSARWKSW